MVAKDFEVDDLVWAKMKGFPPWPAKIAKPDDTKSPSAKKQQHFVYFFGTQNFAWILDEHITPHSEEMLKNSEGYKKKPATLQKAIKELQEESKEAAEGPVRESTPTQPKTPKRPKAQVQKKPAKKRRKSSETKGRSSESPPLQTPQKPDSLADSEENNDIDIKEDSDEEVLIDEESVLDNMPSNNGCSTKVAIIPPFNDDSSAVAHPQPKSIIDRLVVPRPQTPPLDITTPHENLKTKNIKATTKKIGFLGLGMMGRGMVKNLLNSNHDVTVWNRTKEKCKAFVAAGARLGDTPADVVVSCDIIFCCVSDPSAAKTLVFGNCGVLRGLNQCQSGKGYVEMTSVDPMTSIEIAEAVTDKGGRYLEAPVVGCRKRAEEGSLVVLSCGDNALSEECKSCFLAISKNSYYLGCDVGAAAKMNLSLSMLAGNTYAALAESMALVASCKLSVSNFLEVIQQGSLNCELILNKGEAMMMNDYETNTALKHQQKDLALALMLGNNQSQPLHMAASANEIFKRARLLRCSDHDVAAVQIGAKI